MWPNRGGPPMMPPGPPMPPFLPPPRPGMMPSFPPVPPGIIPPYGVMPLPLAPLLAAPTSSTPPAASDLKPGWTEHTAPDGRKYFYHAESKQSSWEKPAIDKAPEASTPWKEHTAPDGRKYYYNKETKVSSWTMPEELKKLQGGSSAKEGPTSSKPAGGAKHERVDQMAKQESAGDDFIYATKAEAKEAFKQLLASCGCTSDWSWEHAMKQIQGKARYDALKSMGEKKQCFNEYVNQRRNEEKEEERRRIRQAREDFVNMVLLSRQVRAGQSFKRARDLLEEDPRWKAVPEREREDLFLDAQKEKVKREKEERKVERRRNMAVVRELLENTPSITIGTEWRKAVKILEPKEPFADIDKMDSLDAYQDYQRELDLREREDRDRDKEEQRRQDRKARDAFRALLSTHRSLGLINVKTRWSEYSEHCGGTEEYKGVEASRSGSRPKELFEYLIEDLEDEYDKAKALVKGLMKEGDVIVTPSTSMDEFMSKLDQVEKKKLALNEKEEGEEAGPEDPRLFNAPRMTLDSIDPLYKSYYFEELLGRAKLREEEEQDRLRRARDKFLILLSELRKIKADSTWDYFIKKYDKEPEFKQLGAEEAKPLFEDYVANLAKRKAEKKEEEEEEGVISDSDSQERRHREKKSSKRRHEDDTSDEERKKKKKDKQSKDSKKRDRSTDRSP